LNDVVSAIFNTKFVTELFKPQVIYTYASTRQIFDRLAHSSIMRLNESSMDKLFDLMTMGVKCQLMAVTHPSDLVQVTLNHLDYIRNLVKLSTDAAKLTDSCQKQFMELYTNWSSGAWFAVRATLLRFLQDRRVKVSLFLQDGIQANDGTIILSASGTLPPNVQTPGTTKYFDAQGKVVRTESVSVRNADNVVTPTETFDPLRPNASRPCKLGTNLYARDRKKDGKSSKAAKPLPPMSPHATEKKQQELDEAARQAARKELNLLAQLIGSDMAENVEKFQVANLFPNPEFSWGTKTNQKTAEIITFDADDARSMADRMGAELDMPAAGSNGNAAGDDLLDLLDRAK